MKTKIIATSAAIALLTAGSLVAQSVVRETVTTTQPAEVVGTVSELVPDAITVRTEETSAPIQYSFTRTTEYVDESGNRISREVLKTGVPVTIRYVKTGDQLFVNRVIVRNVAPPAAVTTKKTTTTTTTTTREKGKD